jgi:hypothetical protein
MAADKQLRRKGLIFLLGCLIVGYGLLSAGVAVMTADTCGTDSSKKHWVFFPPGWDCDDVRF